MNDKKSLIKNKYFALQAQVRDRISGIFHKDSEIDGSRGSATVEAALVFPFFLCAVCSLIVIGQFLLSEASIYHAAIQTVRLYAKQESALQIRKQYHSEMKGEDNSFSRLGGILESNVMFHRYLDKREADSAYVLGGKNGILFTTKKQEDSIQGKAGYYLRVPVPFFREILLKREILVQCRLFTGYVPGEYGDSSDGDGDSAYVAKNGRVYHTKIDCYHLCIHISDQKEIQKILVSSHYRKCKKCMGNGKKPSQIYHTKDGDCYHSSLSCSGLKREVGVVKKSSVPNMRICSECVKHQK